jgi:predicted Ser/Thr protein kinase
MLLTPSEQATLLQLSTLALRNEDDVKRFWVPDLLRVLGYAFPTDIVNEESLPYVYEAQGRATARLVRPDFVVSAAGVPFFVVEAKTPGSQLTSNDVHQARSYARHASVQAPIIVLTCGTRTEIFDAESANQLMTLEQTALANSEQQERLLMLLGKKVVEHKVGPLVLGSRIGSGGFGTVYRGWNVWLQRDEAVKVLAFEPGQERRRDRFVRGTRAVARLAHPSIVKVHSLLPYGNTLVVSMELVDGPALDRWLESRPPLGARLAVFGQIVDAMAFAHGRGVLHRDLSPGNVMIETSPAGPLARLIDFDSATLVDADRFTRTASELGTLGFMAPERIASRRDHRAATADVYSLGALLLYLLTRRPPAGGDLREIEEAVGTARLAASTRSWVVLLLAKSLTREPELRYGDAGEMKEDLDAFREGATLPAGTVDHQVRAFLDTLCAQLVAEPRLAHLHFKGHRQNGQRGIKALIRNFGEVVVLHDEDYKGLFVGYSLGTQAWARFASSDLEARIRTRLEGPLRLYRPNQLEDGGLGRFIPSSELLRRGPDSVAGEIVALLAQFEGIRREAP